MTRANCSCTSSATSLYAEQTLVKALPKLKEEASDQELARGFADHLEETRQHVENLKLAFEELGEPAKAEKCPGIEGIKKEHDEFVANESPSPEVLDAFLTGAGARTEHYEIAAYEGLITMADAMGETKVVRAPDREPGAGEGGADEDEVDRQAPRQGDGAKGHRVAPSSTTTAVPAGGPMPAGHGTFNAPHISRRLSR